MADQQKKTPIHIPGTMRPDEDEATAVARTVLQPAVRAATTLHGYSQDFGEIDIGGLISTLEGQMEATHKGDLKRGEEMLTAQAHTLDAIYYNTLARHAIYADNTDKLDNYLKLALRSQSPCRATWETLATIKNPPVARYVNQANIAHGPQQVNNGTTQGAQTTPARENQNLQNKLLEEKDEERLDTRTTCTASRVDSDMATVGKINRAENN